MNPGNLKVYYVGFRETRDVQLVAICTGLLISVKSNYGCAKKKEIRAEMWISARTRRSKII